MVKCNNVMEKHMNVKGESDNRDTFVLLFSFEK